MWKAVDRNGGNQNQAAPLLMSCDRLTSSTPCLNNGDWGALCDVVYRPFHIGFPGRAGTSSAAIRDLDVDLWAEFHLAWATGGNSQYVVLLSRMSAFKIKFSCLHFNVNCGPRIKHPLWYFATPLFVCACCEQISCHIFLCWNSEYTSGSDSSTAKLLGLTRGCTWCNGNASITLHKDPSVLLLLIPSLLLI